MVRLWWTKSLADSTDQEILAGTGTLLFGERWISPMARALGISQQHVSKIYAADRVLTSEQRIKVAELCRAWRNDLIRRRDTSEKLERYWRETAARRYRPDNIKKPTRSSDDRE
jgi:hypothetical protein